MADDVASVMMMLGLVALSVAGCTAEARQKIGCDAIESQVVDISDGNLVKISKGEMIKSSATEIACEGIGYYSDTSRVRTRYRTYKDDDGEWLVEYDTNETAAEAQKQADDEFNQQEATAEAEADQRAEGALEEAQRILHEHGLTAE